jgi:dienelactone hydrolase
MHVVLFHSAQGLRPVERELADALRLDGHHVTVPDLYDGRSAQTVEDGLVLKDTVGWTRIMSRARESLRSLPDDAVLAGVSIGAGVVSEVWRDRPATAAVLLVHGYAPIPEDVTPGVRAALHVAEDDPFAPHETVADWEATADLRGLVVDVYRYPRLGHFFTDRSSGDYDAAAAATVLQRARDFLRHAD